MCSPFGIRDFPIINSVPVTTSLNAAIYDEIPLDIQWGPKATEPNFIYDGPQANLGFVEYFTSTTSTTTLRLNGNSFNLISVQICTPNHRTLLVQDKQRDCSGEIVMGFKAQNNISESYLFLCVPILMRSTTSPSVYLEALRTGRLDGKPTSLLSVLPKDPHFISYATCLQQVGKKSTDSKQARVFVFTEGLEYPNANFTEIAQKSTKNKPSYLPSVVLPDGLKDKSEAILFSITTETDYKSLLRYSQYFPSGTPDSSQYRTDTLDSYKCVPLEPSQNIKDGKIIVDTDSGELLSQVIKDKDTAKPGGKATPVTGIMEKLIAIAVAVILLIFVFLIMAALIAKFLVPNSADFFKEVQQNYGTIAPVVFFSSLAGGVCFILGLFLKSLVE